MRLIGRLRRRIGLRLEYRWARICDGAQAHLIFRRPACPWYPLPSIWALPTCGAASEYPQYEWTAAECTVANAEAFRRGVHLVPARVPSRPCSDCERLHKRLLLLGKEETRV